jgi:hypothetical protein
MCVLRACVSEPYPATCLNVNKLTKAGCHFKFWVADWFALMNNKMVGAVQVELS